MGPDNLSKNLWSKHLTFLKAIAVVGNKIDLVQMEKVTDDEAKVYAKNLGAIFQLTSAKADTGIEVTINQKPI